MKSLLTNNLTLKAQNLLYLSLNSYSKEHPITGRLASIPIALLDVTLHTSKNPLGAINHLVFAIINLLGAPFSKHCSIKDFILEAEGSVTHFVCIPVGILSSPLKLVYQIAIGLINPKEATSIGSFFSEPRPFHEEGRRTMIYGENQARLWSF